MTNIKPMNILVTGAKGFVGTNLVENLKALRDGKNRTRPNLSIGEIFEYDRESTVEELDDYCARADFVFNLAGVNRPKDTKEFEKGNFGFASTLLNTLKKHGNTCPVMLSSSVQASLSGRFGKSEYGLSKKEGEDLFFRYGQETGAEVLVYRFPNLVGKWCRPNYNSAVATFCYNIAREQPIIVNDPTTELTLVFVEDLVEEMFDALEGKAHHCSFEGTEAVDDPAGKFCYVPVFYRATLGRIVDLLHGFHDQPVNQLIPDMPEGSFEKKLYSMYVSYLPGRSVAYELPTKTDERGSFTELFKTNANGQVSVNIIKPGQTKGQHWHNSKWEFFVVVSGTGFIRERQIGTNPATGVPYPTLEIPVSGENMKAVHMLPGHTHSITNTSMTEDLVVVMWANELFDPDYPDTFHEDV